jgi:curved DNA-binding protein CbpA
MNAEQPDLYAILGLTPRATQEQISHAYRALLREHHPDTRGPADQLRSAVSDAALQQVLAAYAVLGDPTRRADYDRQLGIRVRGTASRPRPPAPRSARSGAEPPIRVGPVRWHRGPDLRYW